MEIFFLNLDIVLYSAEDLSYLHDELKDKVLILHNGFIEENKQKCYLLTFEADLDTDISNASNLITLHLCEIINDLSVRSRQLWNQCDRKIFDYGYQSGLMPLSLSNNLSH